MLAAVSAQYIAGERVDLTVVARELGLGRATIYRWFGSRERLLGLVIADQLQMLIDRHRRLVRRRGVAGLLEVFDRINRDLVRSHALRRLLDQERGPAMRMLTSSSGVVQPRAVSCVERMLAAEVDAGRFDPPADPETVAYAIVRLAEAFIYNDASIGIRGDTARLHDIQAALLGVAGNRRPPLGSSLTGRRGAAGRAPSRRPGSR